MKQNLLYSIYPLQDWQLLSSRTLSERGIFKRFMPKLVSIRPTYKILTSNYLSRTLLFFASYADFFSKNFIVRHNMNPLKAIPIGKCTPLNSWMYPFAESKKIEMKNNITGSTCIQKLSMLMEIGLAIVNVFIFFRYVFNCKPLGICNAS